MSNPYNPNPSWSQSPMGYSQVQLQLEQFDYLNNGNDMQRQQQQQHLQQQQQYSYDTNHFQFSQPQTQTNTLSSLHNVFSTNQQPSQPRAATFSSMNTTQSASVQNPFIPGSYSQTSNRTLNQKSMPNSSNRSNSAPYSFSNNGAPASIQGLSPSNRNGTTSSFLTASPVSTKEYFAPSPSNSEQLFQSPPAFTSPSAMPHAKRPRNQIADDGEDQDGEVALDPKEGARSRPGACTRCKSLKVKCEFKTDTDPCKRCLNGGHECMIPGRKKRRTPPKREHLLNQIREQAAEIEKLMSQLEATTSAQNSHRGHSPSSSAIHSPILSPSSTSSYFGSDGISVRGDNPNSEANKAVEAWIAKAKESFSEFGGFIGIGGAGMPKNYLVDEDFEGGDSDDEEDYVEVEDPDDVISVAVEYPEGQENDVIKPLRHKGSASSISTTGASAASSHIRKKNAAPANLPVEASPFGLFGKLSINSMSRAGSLDPEEPTETPGIASPGFFDAIPAPDTLSHRLNIVNRQAPFILTRGIVTPVEAEKLFQIYFDRMNMSLSLLDPVLYTAQRTFYRSPFLFTVICAIASRFYLERPDLYSQVMHYAQLAAGTALISGNKNVEMCQAFILLSLYPIPAKRWEDQRNWLYLGLAIRTATDINLHLPTTAKPLNENHAREMLNRTRVWLNCFNLDRSTGSQYGKPPIINSNDYMANHSEHWWNSSPYNMRNFDIHISAYNAELKVLSKYISKIYSDPNHPTGLNKEVDFEGIASEVDEELKQLWDKWYAVLEKTDMNDPQNSFRTGLLRLAYGYSRLAVLSYGFQHAFGKNNGLDENPFLTRCLRAASDVVNAVVTDICRPSQIHFWRYGPEAQSVFVTFASAFLIKLLQPKFASYLSQDTRIQIRTLVQSVIDLLGSSEVAIDERHGPKLYSRFLKNLLATPMARIDYAVSPTANSSRRTRSVKSPSEPPDPPFDIPTMVYNNPSPISPPPTSTALSFDNFAPIGPIDPFAPEISGTASHDPNSNFAMTDDFSLPFDDAILQSLQSFSDPSGWRDISLPNFNWMTQFQQDLAASSMSDPNAAYMTDVQ